MRRAVSLLAFTFVFLLFFPVQKVEAQMACSIQPMPILVGCTRQPVAPNGTPHNATHQINLTAYSQLEDGVPSLVNASCGPTSAASIIDYINRTYFPGILNGYTNRTLISNLTAFMNTTVNGTNSDNALFGIMYFLQNRSIMDNFTYKYYQRDYLRRHNGSYPVGYSRNFSHYAAPTKFTWINDNATYANIVNEFVTGQELVIIVYELNYTQLGSIYHHAMALDNIDLVPNTNRNYNISFMDPWDAKIIYGEVDPNGVVRFPQDNVTATPTSMVVVSKK